MIIKVDRTNSFDVSGTYYSDTPGLHETLGDETTCPLLFLIFSTFGL